MIPPLLCLFLFGLFIAVSDGQQFVGCSGLSYKLLAPGFRGNLSKFPNLLKNLTKATTLDAQQSLVTNFVNGRWSDMGWPNLNKAAWTIPQAKLWLKNRWNFTVAIKDLMPKIKAVLSANKFSEVRKLMWDMDARMGNFIPGAYYQWSQVDAPQRITNTATRANFKAVVDAHDTKLKMYAFSPGFSPYMMAWATMHYPGDCVPPPPATPPPPIPCSSTLDCCRAVDPQLRHLVMTTRCDEAKCSITGGVDHFHFDHIAKVVIAIGGRNVCCYEPCDPDVFSNSSSYILVPVPAS